MITSTYNELIQAQRRNLDYYLKVYDWSSEEEKLAFERLVLSQNSPLPEHMEPDREYLYIDLMGLVPMRGGSMESFLAFPAKYPYLLDRLQDIYADILVDKVKGETS